MVRIDVLPVKCGSEAQVGSQSVVDEGMGLVVFRNGIVELWQEMLVPAIVIPHRCHGSHLVTCGLPSQNCCSFSKVYDTSNSILRRPSCRHQTRIGVSYLDWYMLAVMTKPDASCVYGERRMEKEMTFLPGERTPVFLQHLQSPLCQLTSWHASDTMSSLQLPT